MPKKQGTPKVPKVPGSGWEQPRLAIPPAFAMLCSVLEIPVEDVLVDFMRAAVADTSCNSPQPKELARSYLVRCHYHNPSFTTEEMDAMLLELESISVLWPGGADRTFMDLHLNWRKQYWAWWLKKWTARKKHPVNDR